MRFRRTPAKNPYFGRGKFLKTNFKIPIGVCAGAFLP